MSSNDTAAQDPTIADDAQKLVEGADVKTKNYVELIADDFQKLVDLETERSYYHVTSGLIVQSHPKMRELVEDALRWRALKSGRFNLHGTSGHSPTGKDPNGHPYDGYAYYVLEGWSDPRTMGSEEAARNDASARAGMDHHTGVAALRNLRDNIETEYRQALRDRVRNIAQYAKHDIVTIENGKIKGNYKQTMVIDRDFFDYRLRMTITRSAPPGLELGIHELTSLNSEGLLTLIQIAAAGARMTNWADSDGKLRLFESELRQLLALCTADDNTLRFTLDSLESSPKPEFEPEM